MKVIFLDFDGVLTTYATKYKYGDPLCIEQLNRIVAETGARIVVSSSWRTERVKDIAEVLAKWGFKGRVIGCTPRLHGMNNGVYRSLDRGHEIDQWLKDHAPVRPKVILDDDDDMAHLLPFLVRTNHVVGLTKADADKAIAMLNCYEME